MAEKTEADARHGLIHKIRWRMDSDYRALADARKRLRWQQNEIEQLKREKASVEAQFNREKADIEADLEEARALLGVVSHERNVNETPYLAALNADLARLPETPAQSLETPGMQIVPGVAFQFKPDAGVRAEILDAPGFVVRLEDRGESPWFSLTMRLPLSQMQGSRWFGLRVAGAAKHAVTAGAVIRCVRGEEDTEIALPAELVFTATPADNVTFVDLRNRPEIAAADFAELVLFFRQGSFQLELTGFDVFCAV